MGERQETLENGEEEVKETPRLIGPGLPFVVDTLLSVQKLRIAAQVRESHLELNGKVDKETERVRDIMKATEAEIRKLVVKRMEHHPAWPWLKQVKGCGLENSAKVCGLIEIERADTISSLWSFAGYAPVNGKAMKRTKGEKLPYNSQLRTMCWRVGGGLLRAQGCFSVYYGRQKENYQQRFIGEGRKIVPAAQLPKEKGKKVENAAFISEGHIHMMAFRKMVKLWLACLWLVWREAEGLPTRSPYALEHGHTTLITPAEMVDKEVVSI